MDVVHSYSAFPSQCWGCGSSDTNDRPIADFGEYPESMVRRARIYLCAECITGAAKQMAPAVGCVVVPLGEYEQARLDAAESNARQERADELERRWQSLASTVREVTAT